MEYPTGHILKFYDRTDAVREGNRLVIREGRINGDSIDAIEGVFYPVWVDELSSTVYIHFDNIIEEDQ